MQCGCVEIRPHNFLTLKNEDLALRFRNSLNASLVYYYNMCIRTRLIFYRVSLILPIYPANTSRGVLGLIFVRYVLLASQSPYPIIVYSVANYRPHLSHFWANM